MKSHWAIFALALALFVAILAGCASVPSSAAPSSSLSPEVADRLARRVAAAIGGQVWTISGVSMRPFLSERAVVVTEAVNFKDLREGDVVMYANRRLAPTIHRLVARKGEGWVVAGDNNGFPDDDLVTRANLLGRQCAVFFTQ